MDNQLEGGGANIQALTRQREEYECLLKKQTKCMMSLFSKTLEDKFWKDREERLTKLIIRAFFPATICYFLFEVISLPINYFTTEAIYRKHDVLMTLISYTTGWIALLTVYLMAKHPIWRAYYCYVVTAVVIVGLSIVQVVLFSTQSGAMTWRGTLIIIFALMFAYICSGLRPSHTFIAGMVSAGITCLCLWMIGKYIPQWVLFNVLILGNLVGLGLAVLTISTDRIRFLQSIIIGLDKKIYAALNQHLMRLSHQDTLTLLDNRRSFEQKFAQSLYQARKRHRPLALLFIDVDFFKLFNDHYGHQQGDIALISVAEVLKSNIREQDIAIRYGGEEFIILLNNSTAQAAINVAQRLLEQIRKQKILHQYSKISEYLTISIGLTLYTGKENILGKDILKIADNALYQAKKQGRNQYVFMPINEYCYDSDMNNHSLQSF
ncbi:MULTISPECIES: diguanylate cyclase [unclassified Acinetobacter]|uniref:diguanylate cyclase n=1 Tax=unclassified Acinetobacter TaxID=196816 RepID=UPI002577BE56|nr:MULTISPECIES: diguanylate cyclase [unclassified Acinetobacter]MDM1757469.1 GGDEF domain-containing protein [Acinetobacter sp. 256-1]MDM1761481.1 GGDEF domain-containing protein [Acinetobacter sp. 251-1]